MLAFGVESQGCNSKELELVELCLAASSICSCVGRGVLLPLLGGCLDSFFSFDDSILSKDKGGKIGVVVLAFLAETSSG